MGWIGRKWFPEWRGDYCQGWYEPPEGEEPIWEHRPPDFEGTQDNRPIWVMINGREMPNRLVYARAGGADCNIISGRTPQPNGWGFPSTEYYCCVSHSLWLADESEVLEHFDGNKGVFGMWLKERGIKVQKVEKERVKVNVPDALIAEIKAFLEPIVATNPKFIELWKEGKTGPMVGAAMKAAKGKYEGKVIEEVLHGLL
jgi:hypothetical protein